jgi:hypothetical protein
MQHFPCGHSSRSITWVETSHSLHDIRCGGVQLTAGQSCGSVLVMTTKDLHPCWVLHWVYIVVRYSLDISPVLVLETSAQCPGGRFLLVAL